MSVITELLNFQKKTVERMKIMEKNYEGGFLLSEPGLGKSITMLKNIVERGDANPTLIICPAGVIYNWKNEVEKHTKNIRICFYYGNKRGNYNINQIKNVDVIITTYTTIIRDSEKDIVKDIKYGRIILDEGHYIRNENTRVAKGLIRISEENPSAKKWIVTATPFFNRYNDYYSYFRFLGLEGVESKKTWNRSIKNDIGGMKRLNEWIKKYSIKYRKEDVLSELKTKNEEIIKVELNKNEREFYENLKTYSATRIVELIKRYKKFKGKKEFEDMRKIAMNNILVMILRLKQSCNSPVLTVENMERFKRIKNDMKGLNEEMRRIKENVEEDCPICYDKIADTVAEPCGHRCCKKCWKKMMEKGITKCPICRVNVNEIVEDKEEEDKREDEIRGEMEETSKTKKIVEIVKERLKKGEKVVVVSQWVKFLDIIEKVFEKENIKYITLNGKSTMKRRFEYITKFEKDETIRVCCVSMLSSSEGINLISANNMIIIDPWWCDARITQVMDRIHRIGQRRNVNIYKLQAMDSIEEKIQEMTEKKTKLDNLISNKWTIGEGYNADWMKKMIKLICK